MAKQHLLSVQQVKNIKPQPTAQMFNDGGGLYLFVRDYGAKEWIFRYTSPLTKKRRKQSLGSYPDTSLADARRLAGKKRSQLDKGVDPIIQTKIVLKTKQKKHLDNEAKNERTVKNVYEEWKRAELLKRKDRGYNTEMRFRKDVFPEMGDKPIHEVDRPDIKNILDRPLARNANRCANILLSDLKQFFRYADDEELITRDPTRKFIKSRIGGADKKRKRVFRYEELKLLRQKLEACNLPLVYRHAIYLYLATGCRRQEIITTQLPSINIDKKNFYIPPDKSKNTDEHDIYLSDFALKQIKIITSLTCSQRWLIPNEIDDNHLSLGVITRNIRLKQPALEKDGKQKSKQKHTTELELPGGHWILHDLRRTAATIMQQCGIMPHIIKKCLNQRTDDPIMETYQRAELIEEQKQAFIKLGEYLSQIFD